MTYDRLTLDLAPPSDWPAIKRELQAAFAVAVVAEFGPLPDDPIPSDADLDGEAVGGAVVTRHVGEVRNSLDCLFLSAMRRSGSRRSWGPA